ncbi:MAG: Fur family transcriptional regulator [Halanaerobiales bacterium]
MSNYLKTLNNMLSDNNLKVTNQRLNILKELYEADKPLTASEIGKRLKEKNNTVRLSTIYRNLNKFKEAGILKKLNFADLEKKYELNMDHHQHLICIKCGEIKKIECPLKEYEEKIMEVTKYKVIRHDVELYGICPACQKIMNNE